jgi:hypothetical protein
VRSGQRDAVGLCLRRTARCAGASSSALATTRMPGRRSDGRQVAGHFIVPTMLMEMPASRGVKVTAL